MVECQAQLPSAWSGVLESFKLPSLIMGIMSPGLFKMGGDK